MGLELTEVTEQQAEHLAAKGAHMLDEVMPGWAHQIDLDNFDMGIGDMCIVGQLFDDWTGRWLLAKMLDPDFPEMPMSETDLNGHWQADQRALDLMAEYGLYRPMGVPTYPDYEELQEAWETEILARRS